MRQQRNLPAVAAMAVLMLALTACGGDSPATAPGDDNIPTATTSPSPTATQSPSPTENVSTLAPTQPDPKESQVIKGTGTYVGQIDNHSVEIKTEDGPTAFELGPGTENAPAALNMDDPVVFEYVEKSIEGDDSVKQRVLSKLSLAGEELPQNKKLKLEVEGSAEEKVAVLTVGNGYSLYVFDIFTFDPASNKLAMKVDEGYHAEIMKLPSDFNLDYLLLEGQEELALIGEVKTLKESERPEPMADARLYLSATGSQVTRQYIVKEIDGQGYIFKLNIPQREASEGFTPHVFASLNSIVNP